MLPIGSITRRTCVLSIIPVCTIITITQLIKSGGMLVENFAKYRQITATAMFAIDLYIQRAIDILSGGSWSTHCFYLYVAFIFYSVA